MFNGKHQRRDINPSEWCFSYALMLVDGYIFMENAAVRIINLFKQ